MPLAFTCFDLYLMHTLHQNFWELYSTSSYHTGTWVYFSILLNHWPSSKWSHRTMNCALAGRDLNIVSTSPNYPMLGGIYIGNDDQGRHWLKQFCLWLHLKPPLTPTELSLVFVFNLAFGVDNLYDMALSFITITQPPFLRNQGIVFTMRNPSHFICWSTLPFFFRTLFRWTDFHSTNDMLHHFSCIISTYQHHGIIYGRCFCIHQQHHGSRASSAHLYVPGTHLRTAVSRWVNQ